MSYKDIIEEQLRERAVEVGELSWRQKMGRKRSSTLWVWGVGITGTALMIAALFMFFSLLVYPDAPPPWFDLISNDMTTERYLERRDNGMTLSALITIVAGVPAIVLLNVAQHASQALAEQEQERRDDLALRRQFATMNVQDKVAVLGHLSAIEIERLRSIGLVSQEEAKQAEAREARKHELKRDRQSQRHDWRKVKLRLDREMEMWEKKIAVDHKAEPERMRELMDALDVAYKMRDQILKDEAEGKLDEDEVTRRLQNLEQFLKATMK